MKPRQRGLSLAFSTRHRSPSLGRYVRHLRRTAGVRRLQILVAVNPGRESLAQVYNRFLAQARHETLCLLHDDLRFARNRRWGRQIIQAFARHPEYAVFSAAGSVSLASHGVYWLPRTEMLGQVNHRLTRRQVYLSHYSPAAPMPLPALVLDGLLLAVQRTRLQTHFDTRLPGFHFYDIAFTLKQSLAALQTGVPGCAVLTNLGLTHLSLGQPDKNFEQLRQQFIRLYATHLPAHLPLKPRYAVGLPGLASTTPKPSVALWLWHHQQEGDPEALRQHFAQGQLPPQEVCLFTQQPIGNFSGTVVPLANWPLLQQALLDQAQASQAEYLLLLDTQVEPWQDWLPAMLRRFVQHPRLGILGVRLHDAETGAVHHMGLEWVRKEGQAVDVALRGIHSPYGYQEALEQGILGCSGVAMLLRRQHFIAWGGWQSAWIPGFELNLAAQSRGWERAVDGMLAGSWQAAEHSPKANIYRTFLDSLRAMLE